jgi:ABC-type sugar transport system substrate-binding protein
LTSFESVLKQRSPGITIVERRAAANNEADSELVVTQVLLSHPEVNAIFGLDSMAADGAYLALKARSLTDRIKTVGVEQDTGMRNALRLRQIDSILAKDAYQMGYRAVESIMVEQSRQPGMIRLAPMLVTADNLDSAAAQRFVDWRRPHQ